MSESERVKEEDDEQDITTLKNVQWKERAGSGFCNVQSHPIAREPCRERERKINSACK